MASLTWWALSRNRPHGFEPEKASANLVEHQARAVAILHAPAIHGAEQRRDDLAILNAGGNNLAFERQACCIGGLRPLIFLPASTLRRPPTRCSLDHWLSTTTAVGTNFAAFLLCAPASQPSRGRQ